jgi:predicted nucleic acid-binding protein
LTSIYIDSSAWNRKSDEQVHSRVREETIAVDRIIQLIMNGELRLVFSQALQEEMTRHPDIARGAASIAKEYIKRSPEIDQRATQLQRIGLGNYDALHIACAEAAGADLLITTDDQMIKKAQRAGVHVRLVNPVEWLRRSGLGRKAAALASVHSN